MSKRHPLVMSDLFSKRQARLRYLQSICVLTAWPQVLCQGKECEDFSRAASNLAGGLEGLLTKVKSLGETGRAWHRCSTFIHSARNHQHRQAGGQPLAVVELLEEGDGLLI